MIAIIKAGGKQFIVRDGQTLKVEALAGTKAGDTVEFEVLLRAEEDGSKVEMLSLPGYILALYARLSSD